MKPENFLIKTIDSETADQAEIIGGSISKGDEVKLLKLADFGLARSLSGLDPNEKLTEYVATRWYRAPELLIHQSSYTQAVDIFALGCIMAELYLGRPIFPGRNEQD